MAFPWQLSLALTKYLVKNKLLGRKRFPLLLMLEPSLRCNLSCEGCGRVREFRSAPAQMLSAGECLAAVEEARTPVVAVSGGEPLLHPEIEQIVREITARKRFVYLTTNGLLLEKSLEKFKPGPYFSFVLHLDGLAESHNRLAGQEGVFETAIAGMKLAKQAGFRVLTNTTIYKGTSPAEIEQLFLLLSRIPVDGMMVAPAFSYEAVDGDVFLSRDEIKDFFSSLNGLRRRFPFYNTPIYLDFLSGEEELTCTPWGNPTRSPGGWRKPCYLITDDYCQSLGELLEETPWEKYGAGNDPRCANCMTHCGFEASAINETGKNLANIWRTIRWHFAGG